MDAVFDAAADAALCIIEHGVTEAMNRYNGLDLGAGEEGTKEPGSDV